MSNSYHDDTQASISSATKTPLAPEPQSGLPFSGPWFLTIYGMLLRDSERAYDQVELQASDQGVEMDQSDAPVLTGRNFENMLNYLPLMPHLTSKFKRDEDGKMRQIKKIYFVLEGYDKVITDAVEAGVRHRARGNEWAAIHVLNSRTRAEELIEGYVDVKAEAKLARRFEFFACFTNCNGIQFRKSKQGINWERNIKHARLVCVEDRRNKVGHSEAATARRAAATNSEARQRQQHRGAADNGNGRNEGATTATGATGATGAGATSAGAAGATSAGAAGATSAHAAGATSAHAAGAMGRNGGGRGRNKRNKRGRNGRNKRNKHGRSGRNGALRGRARAQRAQRWRAQRGNGRYGGWYNDKGGRRER
ncbi:hypothetical protein DFH06DRAFT_1118527 [Mycena polygramma]|nr:hypothetical protein DFH06DRAFT_1118527 [Mycena polygramma]